MPSDLAVAFILATKAVMLPASHCASISAMLSAEATRSAWSACCSVSTSPAVTASTEPEDAASRS